jgi:hypothetical protein
LLLLLLVLLVLVLLLLFSTIALLRAIPTLTYCFDILSGIDSEILSGIVFGNLFGICSGPGVAHSIWS